MRKLIAVVMLFAGCAWAQSANPVVDAARHMLTGRQKNMVAAAQEMPADKYSYKPTPEQISFGHVVAHTASSNNALCAFLGGEEPQKSELKESDGKDKLVAAFSQSFDNCSQQLEKLKDADLSQEVTLRGEKRTKATLLLMLVADWADHYSQMAMYLRLNKLLPPTAKK